MCLALPNSYAQGEEVIAWTLMVIHFFVPFWQKALFFGLENTACTRLTPTCL
jgi:hypothetical protein